MATSITPPSGYTLDQQPSAPPVSSAGVTPPAGYKLDQPTQGSQPRSWADKMGLPTGWAGFPRVVVDAAEGATSGLASTVFHTGDLIRRGLGMQRIIDRPDVQVEMTPPNTLAGKLGKVAEQVGEFALPMSAAADITKGASLATRALAEGATSGGVSALQTGGDPTATALSAATGAAGPVVGQAVKSGAQLAMAKFAGMAPRPLSADAIALANQYGVPLTRGALGGSKTVQAVEKILGHTVAPDLYEALMQKGQQGVTQAASSAAGGFGVDQFAAGDNTVQKLLQVAEGHAQNARSNYAALDAIEADPANTKTITVGSKPSSILGPNGQPVMQPVTQDIPLPVYMTGAKSQLKPIRDMIAQQLPVAQQQYSAGLHAIQNVLDGPDVVSASTAEANLSAIKQIQREAVSDKVKRMASMALDAVSPQVDQAIATANPGSGTSPTQALAAARQSWKTRSQVLDLVDQLSGDASGKTGQTLAAQRLVRPADASYPMLQQVLATAPAAKSDLGQAYLGQVFKKASTGEFTNPTQAQNLWNQIGPRTKAALYTPQQINDVNATIELAKRFSENPNPSGTGVVNSLIKLGVLATQPVTGGAAIVIGRNAAKILYDPAGASALRTLMQGTASPKALTLVKSLIGEGAEAAGSSSPPQ